MDALSKPAVTTATIDLKTGPTAPQEAKGIGDKAAVDLYLTYHMDHDVPFVADYYGIEAMMDFQDLSYKAEVDTIDKYLVDEVRGQRLANTTEAIKGELAKLEKLAGVNKNTPTSIRVKQLAAYSEFLQKANVIRRGY